MKLLVRVPTLGDAFDRYYRAERLNRTPTTRDHLIADRQADIARDGWAVLASAHDSVTGRMVGVAPQAGIFLVYES